MAEQLVHIQTSKRELTALLALQALDTKSIAKLWPRTKASIMLGARSSGLPPTMFLELRSLVGFMRAEVALILCGGTKVMSCAQCGNFFIAGAGRNAGSKRSGAIYCSPRCRVAAVRSRKKLA